MLGVEDVVHRRQADVLVDPPVAGDEVRIEQLVVVRARRSRLWNAVDDDVVHVGVAVLVERGAARTRNRVVRDVVEEGVAGLQRLPL